MAWRIVKQPNGLYARFSDVVDDFTHYDMTEEEAVDLCLDYLGRQDSREKVGRAKQHPERYEDEFETIKIVHGESVARERRDMMEPRPG